MIKDPCSYFSDVPIDTDAFQTLIEDPFDEGCVKTIAEFVERRSDSEIQQFICGDERVSLNFGENNEDLSRLIDIIDEDPSKAIDVPPQLNGLSGFVSFSALKTMLHGVTCEARGKIRDFIYLPEKEEGHISVDVWTDCSGQGLATSQQIEFVHWDIELKRSFIAHPRDEENTDNPFPTVALELPAASKDRSNPKGIWMRNLNFKIHARGPESIHVHRVYQRIGRGPLKLLPEAHRYYKTTEGSCIDLMISASPPERPLPTTYGELPQEPVSATVPNQLGYCLGRCQHPSIVNTDAD